ncbi:tRNA splicing endonuclease subunit SEN2 Ecym_4274 [Eremothecium cymbalariae DBVPG|uniref:tRNA-splicing endonuclease subunit Sen2 n=1 Tax=Eremothecium cymbalariae (strain CBS 270.75 / DBVPG 7215 / KCTC 17166 / NRRL Y-17582) TaxID=931890 RepID=G8JTI5_ERECY|nr:hypothetical protein Ecym_4274 [Eremothecium cymbalariae DBVPG\
MAKYISNRRRYEHKLPLELIQLPPLIPHNPVSWLHWIFKYVTAVNYMRQTIPVEIDASGKIIISDHDHMRYLWERGFFGTGQLSRSEPTWYERTASRLQLDGSKQDGVQLEQVTRLRRKQRLEFKKERAKFEEKKLHLRMNGVLESEILGEEQAFLKSLRDQELQYGSVNESGSGGGSSFEGIRMEDSDILTEDGTGIIKLEKLELMPVEAMFLTFALPVLDISMKDLLHSIFVETPSFEQIEALCMKYAAYHHYRSHGWCVRSGVKFGCDYMLYRQGPPFHHAEFSVMVLHHNQAQHDYTWYSTVARVVGGAKKCLVLCYISKKAADDILMELWSRGSYAQAFALFEVNELVYRRWVPGKNRD